MSDQQTQVVTQLGALVNQPNVADVAKAAIALIAQQAQQITDDQALIQKQTALITKLQSTPVVTPPPANNPPPAPPHSAGTSFTIRSNDAGLHCDFDGTPCVPDAEKLAVRMTWNFGDGSPEAEGYNSAHVYQAAGQYTVTLKIQSIDNKGAPTGAAATVLHDTITVTPSKRTVVNVQAGTDLHQFYGKTNLELVLAPGVYPLSSGMAPVDCVFRCPTGTATINPAGNWTVFAGSNSTYQNIAVDWPAGAKPKDASAPRAVGTAFRPGSRVAIIGCMFLNVGDAINLNSQPNGVLVEGCKSPLLDGISGYFMFVQGTNIVVLGNTVANCIVNHVLRSQATTVNLAIFGNDFSNVSAAVSGVANDYSRSAVEIHDGKYISMAKNKFRGDGSNGGGDGAAFGPLDIPTDPGIVAYGLQIDNDCQGYAGIGANASNIAILGNRWHVWDAWFKPSNAITINTNQSGPYNHAPVSNVTIGGNTFDKGYNPFHINGPVPVGLVSDVEAS